MLEYICTFCLLNKFEVLFHKCNDPKHNNEHRGNWMGNDQMVNIFILCTYTQKKYV